MAGMNMSDMMAIMKDLPKFAEQAKDLIAKVRTLSNAVDAYQRVEPVVGSGIADSEQAMYSANAELKLALANLPRLPNVIEG